MSGLMNNNLIIVSLLSIFCYSCYVKIFRKLGQIEREEGLRSHKKKTGTITMGGIIFIILPIFFIKYKPEIYLIYLSFLSFGLIGFIDDLLIIKYHKNDGLKAKVKLIIEILISGIIFYYYLDICNNTILDLYFIINFS